ncbi:MAG: sigma-70 family RNA polymerase sigma factor [Planctomycetota bacterium]
MSAPTDRPASPAAPPSNPARAPELDAAIRAGLTRLEPEALQVFFDHYFDRVYAYLRRLVREEHLAEDLTQDVFLHVHRSLPRYDPERPLSPWVYTIATNKVRDHWRSRRHQEERRIQSVDDEDAGVELTARDGAPTAELESNEASAQVAAAVAELPDVLRETFVLRFYEGQSFEEIGRIVDRNETAVRKRYSRALQELRGVLEHLVDR